MKSPLSVLLLLFFSFPGCRQQQVRIDSPDHYIHYTFRLNKNKPEYSVSFKGINVIGNSTLNLVFENTGSFGENLEILKPEFREGRDDYPLIVGKTSRVIDQYREVIIPLHETITPFRKINVAVRLFNDGLAFRYEIPQQDNWTSFSLMDENTNFLVMNNPRMTTIFLPGYTTSHEGEFSSFSLNELKEDTLMDLPVLFEFPDKIFMAVTEAGLRDYAGMYLIKSNGMLQSRLSPLPGKPGVKVQATIPHVSPWRVLLISDRIGALIESNIITSLNEPCKLKDVSWIKPGKTTWSWWNGNIVGDKSIVPGNNFETSKYYIDFCARNGIEYHSVIEYDGHAWYVNDGKGFEPGLTTDVTKPVPGLDMQKIFDYAKQNGVGIRLWVHWAALYPKIDAAFSQYENWGIKGLMVDFMDRDDQDMVNIQENILKKAADHKLHIQFHGAYKPTGLWRTYPNEFTREGVMNYEYNKWSKITPDHDINVPFTRMIAGPTDYHMGGFRAVPDSLYKSQYNQPLVLGTRCHMLALYVVLENYLNMVADYPDAYEGQPGFDFIKEVPTVWDETRVLNAEAGKYITIARRKKNDWYIGAITNHEARSIPVDFSFLPEGKFEAAMYSDVNDSCMNPNHLEKQVQLITNKDLVTSKLSPGGGMAMHLVRK